MYIMNNDENQEFSFYRQLYNLREDGKMTLSQLHAMIVGPKLKFITNEIRRLDAAGKEKQTKKQKLSLPLFAVSYLFPEERYSDQAGQPTGYVLADVDELAMPATDYLERCKALPFVALAYVSARGKGVHLICRAETDVASHADVCQALFDTIEATLGEPVDRVCIDLTRTSLLCHDPACHYNPQAEPFRRPAPPSPQTREHTRTAGGTGPCALSEAERLALYLDRADQRLIWQKGQRHSKLVSLAFSLNRAGFDRLTVVQACIFRYAEKDFDDKEISKIIDSVYNKSAFEHGANRREYSPKSSQRTATSAIPATKEPFSGNSYDETDEQVKNQETPYFDRELLKEAPLLLKDMIRSDLSGRQFDIALVGALGTLSTLTPRVKGSYQGKNVSPTLYLYVVAPAGFGKGILNEIHKATDVWHQYIRDISRAYVLKYEEELAAYEHHVATAKKNGKNPILTPPAVVLQKELDLPGTITQAKLTEQMKTNEHYPALLCETEIGVLVEAINNEHGKYVYLLNQIAQQEAIGRGSLQNKIVTCQFPLMSLLTSGTRGQFKRLINSTDDGLFSRFLGYTINEAPEWKELTDIDDTPAASNYYPLLGERLKETGIFLDEHPTFVRYTDAQRKRMNRRFEKMSKKVRWFKGDDLLSVVHRLGNYHFRICMLLTALRKAEEKSTSEVVIVRDIDFDIAMMFIQTFHKHIDALSSLLPESPASPEYKNSNCNEQFFQNLSGEFTTAHAIELAQLYKIPERTAERLLTKWLKIGLLTRPSRGLYRKTNKYSQD